jgi:hypothetical protein
LDYYRGREGRGDTPRGCREGVWGVFRGRGGTKNPTIKIGGEGVLLIYQNDMVISY